MGGYEKGNRREILKTKGRKFHFEVGFSSPRKKRRKGDISRGLVNFDLSLLFFSYFGES
jgi:hypothetical protein